MNEQPACRVCRSSRVTNRGELPDGVEFAGRPLDPPIPGGPLWVCRDCSLHFRHPILPADRYDVLYRNGGHDVWTLPNESRQDFRLICELLKGQTAAADVLDVGCYDGQLLGQLAANYRRFGVEINEAAAERARDRDIAIVARNINELVELQRAFDVVIACDVIEHTADPLAFLRTLRRLVKRGGQV